MFKGKKMQTLLSYTIGGSKLDFSLVSVCLGPFTVIYLYAGVLANNLVRPDKMLSLIWLQTVWNLIFGTVLKFGFILLGSEMGNKTIKIVTEIILPH